MTNMNIKLLTPTAKLPLRGSEYAAGYDLYSDNTRIICIPPHTTAKIATGIAVELPEGTFGGIFARSGLATKEGLRPCQGTSVIDEDYTGEIFIPLHNDSDEMRFVEPGQRIAQLIILPYVAVEFNIVEELQETERGEGGFGSTGKG